MSDGNEQDELPDNGNKKREFEKHDGVIQKWISDSAKVARALLHIRTNDLHLLRFESWEAYCHSHGFSKVQANRLIFFARVIKEFGTNGFEFLPERESHARMLRPLKTPELRKLAWDKVVAIKDEKTITAEVIEAVVVEELASGDTEGDTEGDAEGDAEGGEREELEPLRLADGSEVSEADWLEGVLFDRTLVQKRLNELSDGGDPSCCVRRQRLLVGIVSLMNRYLDQQPGEDCFQDLRAVSSSINKLLLVGAKPGYYAGGV